MQKYLLTRNCFDELVEEDSCPICLDEKAYTIRFHCKHCVCYKCYGDLVSNACPICRQDIK